MRTEPHAIAVISSVAAISRLIGRLEAARMASRSPSRMCRRIFAQMDRDAVRPGGRCNFGGARRIGMRTAAGVPNGRHMIDVHP
jgi:hypothetical protein